jgi:hypothetical protein
MPSNSKRRRASSRAHVCILMKTTKANLRVSQCSVITPAQAYCYARERVDMSTGKEWHQKRKRKGKEGKNSRSVRLESICNGGDDEAAVEAVVEESLPALLLVLLARPQTPQPAAGWVVVVAVVAVVVIVVAAATATAVAAGWVSVRRVFGAQGAGHGQVAGGRAQGAARQAFGQHGAGGE